MPNFNDMYELNVGLIFFSAFVTFFFLIGVLLIFDKKRPYIKHFIGLLLINIMMHLGEAGIWMIDETRGSKTLLKICCFLSFGGGAVLITEYSYCLIEFIRERKEVSASIRKSLTVIIMIGLRAKPKESMRITESIWHSTVGEKIRMPYWEAVNGGSIFLRKIVDISS